MTLNQAMNLPPPPAPPPLAWRMRLGALVLPLLILGVLTLMVATSAPLRMLLAQALVRLRPLPVVLVLPVQAAAIWLCSVALWLLKPGVCARASFESRLLRDAGNNMLLILPGLGEAIGARIMVLAGARARAAICVRALDILAETLGQLPYIVIALFILAHIWRHIGASGLAIPDLLGGLVLPMPVGWGWPAVLACVVVGVVVAAGLAWRWARGPGRRSRLVRRLKAEWWLLSREMAQRRSSLPVAVVLHVLAWGLSGVQIWLAAWAFGVPLSIFGAIAMESAASAMRVILFFVPGGLVTQEAGVIGAGLAFGLAPSASLALALVLRLRDIVFGLALLWWPVREYRARAALRALKG